MQQLDSRRIIRTWLISGSIILAILAVAAIQLRYTYQLTVANTTERAAAKSFLISEWIAKSFDLHKYVLLETLSDYTVADLVYPSANSTEHERQTSRIIQRVERTPNMVFLGLLNSDCVVTHTSIGINLGFDAKATEREYCTLAKNEPIDAFKISNMFVSVDNTMNVTISMAMLSELGEFQGFALAGLDLGFFQRWLDLVDLEQEYNVISIYDLNSRQLARKPMIPEQIGREVVEERLNNMAQQASPSHFTHRIVSPVDGIERVWSLRRIQDLPFMVVVGEQTQAALIAWRQQLYFYLLAAAVLALSIFVSTVAHIKSLQQAHELRELATIDPLTGLANRRSFSDNAKSLFARAQRSGNPVCLIMADLDLFKQINDNYGHEMGDRVLVEVGVLIKKLCRQGDLVARWGGEEFLILLPDTSLEGGLIFSERLRESIKSISVSPGMAFSVSQGIALYTLDESLESVVSRADSALYRAKELGRNRTEIA